MCTIAFHKLHIIHGFDMRPNTRTNERKREQSENRHNSQARCLLLPSSFSSHLSLSLSRTIFIMLRIYEERSKIIAYASEYERSTVPLYLEIYISFTQIVSSLIFCFSFVFCFLLFIYSHAMFRFSCLVFIRPQK